MAVGEMGSLPLGFRFPPTDEELIDFYLRFKINGQNDHVFVIREMELRDLPDFGTMSQLKGSPYRDLETEGSNRSGDDEESCSSPLNIPSTKNASIERVHRWRQAALVLNASRRFRYTLDLKKEEAKKQAAYLFKAAGEQQVNGILCQLKTRHGTRASHLTFRKNVVGVVATTLGKVDDYNL